MEELEKSMIENYVNSYNRFDLQGMVKDLSDRVIFENCSNGFVDLRTEGIDVFKTQAQTAMSYFAERKQTINSWEFHEDKVSIEISYRAILAIDLPNGLKKGDSLELNGKSVFEFDKEKIIKITDHS